MGWPRSLKKRPFLWLFLCPKSADFLLKLYTLWPLFDILESDSLAGAVGPHIAVPWSRIRRYVVSERAKKAAVLCEKIPFGIYHFDHVFPPNSMFFRLFLVFEVARFWYRRSVCCENENTGMSTNSRRWLEFSPDSFLQDDET